MKLSERKLSAFLVVVCSSLLSKRGKLGNKLSRTSLLAYMLFFLFLLWLKALVLFGRFEINVIVSVCLLFCKTSLHNSQTHALQLSKEWWSVFFFFGRCCCCLLSAPELPEWIIPWGGCNTRPCFHRHHHHRHHRHCHHHRRVCHHRHYHHHCRFCH